MLHEAGQRRAPDDLPGLRRAREFAPDGARSRVRRRAAYESFEESPDGTLRRIEVTAYRQAAS